MKKDHHIYFPIVKLKRTRFNVEKSCFEYMNIKPGEARIFKLWSKMYATPELINQLAEKTGVKHDHH